MEYCTIFSTLTLTTILCVAASRYSFASVKSEKVLKAAVGSPCLCINAFDQAFEDSNTDAACDGPKHKMFYQFVSSYQLVQQNSMKLKKRMCTLERIISDRPSTSGCSGPTTTSAT